MSSQSSVVRREPKYLKLIRVLLCGSIQQELNNVLEGEGIYRNRIIVKANIEAHISELNIIS